METLPKYLKYLILSQVSITDLKSCLMSDKSFYKIRLDSKFRNAEQRIMVDVETLTQLREENRIAELFNVYDKLDLEIYNDLEYKFRQQRYNI